MNDLDTLRPEVLEALIDFDSWMNSHEYHERVRPRRWFKAIRAELLRLAEYEQAAGRLAIEKAELRQCAEQCEAELAAMPDADEWHALRERAERAEAELAALKARIEGSPSAEVWGVQGVAGLEPSYTVRETPAVVVTPLLSGKRVRLVVDEPAERGEE